MPTIPGLKWSALLEQCFSLVLHRSGTQRGEQWRKFSKEQTLRSTVRNDVINILSSTQISDPKGLAESNRSDLCSLSRDLTRAVLVGLRYLHVKEENVPS